MPSITLTDFFLIDKIATSEFLIASAEITTVSTFIAEFSSPIEPKNVTSLSKTSTFEIVVEL